MCGFEAPKMREFGGVFDETLMAFLKGTCMGCEVGSYVVSPIVMGHSWILQNGILMDSGIHPQ